MKTLKQIIEGAVVMSDFKLDRKGRKYKAHRMSMGDDKEDMKEATSFADAVKRAKEAGGGKLPPSSVPSKFKEKMAAVSRTGEKGQDIFGHDSARQQSGYRGQGQSVMQTAVDKAKNSVVGKALAKSGRMFKHVFAKEEVEQDLNPYTKVYEEDTFTKTLPRMGNKALDTAKGLISPYEKAMSDMSPGSDYYKKNIENNPEAKAKVDDFMKSAPKASELDSSIDKTKQKFNKALTNKGTVGDSVEEDTSIMRSKESQGVKRLPTVREIEKADKKEIEGQFTDKAAETESPFNNRTDVYNKPSKGSKVVNKLADFESVSFSTFSRTSVLDEAGDREIMNKERSRVLAKFIKGATPKNGQVVNNIDTSGEVTEARGRPAGAATLAKRAAAASKPREDDDEGEHYDSDSGVEADQHIHVQLKKAADSDQKPFEVSFRNGKKHSVSQKVAKDVLSATERLKPEHRKNVHDEIHQSYDNLMSVHRLIARR